MARIRGTISQEILHKIKVLANTPVSMYSLRFWPEVFKRLFEDIPVNERAVKDAFYYLKKKGLIAGEVENNQLYIRLTLEGEKEAGKYQINRMEIRRPKEWDKKWRLIIFDIPEKRKIKREAFRGKLKELGFYPLQKSVWVFPFPCEKEIKLLREFFNLEPRHLRIFKADELEEDKFLKEFFALI